MIEMRRAQLSFGDEGCKMRVDTTVVETNIHYPTNSSLLGDGVRVLIRTMKKITRIVGDVGFTRSISAATARLAIGQSTRSKRSRRSIMATSVSMKRARSSTTSTGWRRPHHCVPTISDARRVWIR